MAWWRKGILLLSVCTVHFAALYRLDLGFQAQKSGPNGHANDNREGLRLLVVELASPTPPQLRPPVRPTTPLPSPVSTLPFLADLDKPRSSQTAAVPDLIGQDFLEADVLDVTAEPEEGFQAALTQSMPLFFSTIEIELWIDSSGQTVRVLCAGLDCTESCKNDLQQLLNQHFKPARKDGMAVASKKLIQIEQAPTMGM